MEPRHWHQHYASWVSPSPVYEEIIMPEVLDRSAASIPLTHANLCKDVQIIASWFPKHLVTGSMEISPIPIFHAYGLTSVMNLSTIKGWTNVIIPLPQPR